MKSEQSAESIKNRIITVLLDLGLKLSDYSFDLNALSESPNVLVDCTNQHVGEYIPVDDNFDGNNGWLCNPTNWNAAVDDAFFVVVSNDWNSVTFKVCDNIYFKVERGMIYEWKQDND